MKSTCHLHFGEQKKKITTDKNNQPTCFPWDFRREGNPSTIPGISFKPVQNARPCTWRLALAQAGPKHWAERRLLWGAMTVNELLHYAFKCDRREREMIRIKHRRLVPGWPPCDSIREPWFSTPALWTCPALNLRNMLGAIGRSAVKSRKGDRSLRLWDSRLARHTWPVSLTFNDQKGPEKAADVCSFKLWKFPTWQERFEGGLDMTIW